MKLKIVVWMIVLLSMTSFAYGLGVSPASITFEDMTRNGYAEQEILISEVFTGDFTLEYDSNSEWVIVEFEKPTVGLNSPTKAIVKANLPEDAGNGEYDFKVRIYATPESTQQGEKASSIISAVSINIKITVTGTEIASCAVGGVSASNTEQGYPTEISTSIKNDGNVRLRPEVKVEIYDQLQENLLLEEEYTTDEILPTTTSKTINPIENNLAIGQYWAKIQVPLCNYVSTRTFDVVQKGEIVDRGELVRINFQASEGSITPIRALFKNTGPRIVSAKFKGEILKDGKIVELIETDLVDVNPGETEIFEAYYENLLRGEYVVKGRVLYNNKLSYEKTAAIDITGAVVSADTSSSISLWPISIITIIIILLVMIIRKRKRIKRY